MKTRLETLKSQLEEVYSKMPSTHFEMEQRNKSAFIISREIEKLENPAGYEENKNHWDNHEIRF